MESGGHRAAFANAGALVVASDVALRGLEETAALIRTHGHRCETVVADTSQMSDVDALVDRCLQLGGLAVMVANAGVSLDHAFVDVTEHDLDATFAVNLKGVVFSGQAAARAMIGLGHGGSIINVASIYSEMAAEGCSAVLRQQRRRQDAYESDGA